MITSPWIDWIYLQIKDGNYMGAAIYFDIIAHMLLHAEHGTIQYDCINEVMTYAVMCTIAHGDRKAADYMITAYQQISPAFINSDFLRSILNAPDLRAIKSELDNGPCPQYIKSTDIFTTVLNILINHQQN